MTKPGAVQRLEAIENKWQMKATMAAIEAARAVIAEGHMNGRAPISSISELQWGWIICAAIFGWIKVRAQQAVAEGRGYEDTITFMPDRNPQAWDVGAVESILPSLGKLRNVDWSKPLNDWSKEEMVSFAWQIHSLIAQAQTAQLDGGDGKVTQFSQAQQERELSAKNGGSLVSRGELDDPIPF